MQSVIFPVIRFLHDLFTATWIGGMLTMVLVVLPALKMNPMIKEPRLAINAIQNRLKVVALTSMAGLALTGLLLGKREPQFAGLLSFGNRYATMLSIKHILMILMVLLAVLRLMLNKRNQSDPDPKREKTSALVLVVNAICGVVVLFLSASLSAMA